MMPDFLFRKSGGDWAVNLDLYYPPFLERLLEAKAKALERGCAMYSRFGYRNWATQHQLRRKFLNGTGGKAAPAGLSAHNYGLADDSYSDADLEAPGLQPSWDPKKYAIYGEELGKVGLVWGASFGDSPHAQWPGFVSAGQIVLLQNIWKACPPSAPDSQKLKVVWQYLDSLPPPPRK